MLQNEDGTYTAESLSDLETGIPYSFRKMDDGGFMCFYLSSITETDKVDENGCQIAEVTATKYVKLTPEIMNAVLEKSPAMAESISDKPYEPFWMDKFFAKPPEA